MDAMLLIDYGAKRPNMHRKRSSLLILDAAMYIYRGVAISDGFK